jgi:hypothetical protein
LYQTRLVLTLRTIFCFLALMYAYQYHTDRDNWKFNKAKQEYLIRHMLTPPLEQEGTSVAQGEEQEQRQEAEAEAETETHTNLADQHWPDVWNRCVAKYLITIQGAAKERLIDTLTKASQRDIPKMVEAVDQSNVVANTSEPPAPAPAAAGSKSVSFGALAMEQDAAGKIDDGVNASEIRRLEFEKTRSKKMLDEMHA